MKITNSLIKKLLSYIVWGGIAAIVDLTILYILTSITGIHYLISQTIAFCVSFFVLFFIQKHITFANKSKKYFSQLLYFLLFQWIGLCINLILLHRFVEYIQLHYMIWSILAKGIVLVWNFTMNYYYNFKD